MGSPPGHREQLHARPNSGVIQHHLNTYKLGVFNPSAYVMWEPDERPPFGPNAYDDACNSPDPADNGGVGLRHSGAVTMGFSGHVDVINFRKWEAEQLRKPGLLFCNPFTQDGLRSEPDCVRPSKSSDER